MDEVEGFKSELLSVINERQQVTYNDLSEYASSKGIDEAMLKRGLAELQAISAIASRSSGGIPTYYILQEKNELRRILIVEDDRNINKLVSLSVGKGFDITQIYDGGEAMRRVKQIKPDLVVLDLMLPGADGLEICQKIKTDPDLKNAIVIIISAMEATSNRFKGIKYGADYYIKKPFDPDELRSLVTIFLKKKGKRFDPLIDLPNEAKISGGLEKALQDDEEQEIGRLRVEGFADFAKSFGVKSGITILRLISQILQDKVRDNGKNVFVGFLNSDDFVIAGNRDHVGKMVSNLKEEFAAVVPFIYQSEGYKPIEKGLEDPYEADRPRLSLSYVAIPKGTVKAKRAEILKGKNQSKGIGSYTYDELRRMLGSDNLDIIITRDDNGVKLSVGKGSGK
ncbi:MAG: response regulator [Candidatus Micrarchaeota archaeon]|nr:response regulator [Candidatus Micrarchaeota archaeon]MDE1804661.1 response regulator [Candidatus Micrarchaeota archaeon]MDE1846867.1 response regulator [Candidatus Micrarchaeota archaeon]